MISLFETYLKFTGYDISHASNELKQIQSLSVEEFQKWQSNKKWEIARYHYDNNPFYRKKVGNHFPDKWEDLPIMEKSDYQGNLENLLSRGYTRKRTYVHNTSGSSGHPFFFAKNKEAHAMDWAFINNRYSLHGLEHDSKQARFFGIPFEKWSHLNEKLKDLLMNRVRFSVFGLSDSTLQSYIEKFNKIKFGYIYGYTNSLVLFARLLLNKNIILKDVCPTLTHCITTSEILTMKDRKLLSSTFGVQVINEYGTSEVGLVAFESPEGEWLLCEEILFHEIIDLSSSNSDNGTGNIIITDFDNKAMPFIRYNIGDIGMICKNNSKNYKLRKLEKLLGRENDMIILPDNRKLPGFAIVKPFDYYCNTNVSKNSGNIKEFVFRQTKPNKFILDMVIDQEITKNQFNKIKQIIESSLDYKINFSINRVDKIQRPKSGKLKQFYSEIS